MAGLWDRVWWVELKFEVEDNNALRPILASMAYVFVAVGLRRVMRRFPKLRPHNAIKMHNLFMTFLSLCILVGMLAGISIKIYVHGFRQFLSGEDIEFDGILGLCAYTHYLSKYISFFDTAFLLLKKKPLSYHHIWKHASVCPLVFCWIHTNFVFSSFCILLDVFPSVFLYWHYFMCELSEDISWWTTSIPVMELFQLFLGTDFLLGWCGIKLLGGTQSSPWSVVLTSLFFYTSCLVLFWQPFYMHHKRPTHQTLPKQD
ncbi:GNS1/SUR4 family [Pelomyxa schiedti]|nr:GNS1/SUR4 family [Pelomyxa schiedti]